MKYDERLYLNSGFYDCDEEVQNLKEKIVKCRKPHKCMGGCNKTIEIGQKAMYESGFLDGKPVSTYTCLECIEKWLEESEQVETPYDCGDCQNEDADCNDCVRYEENTNKEDPDLKDLFYEGR